MDLAVYSSMGDGKIYTDIILRPYVTRASERGRRPIRGGLVISDSSFVASQKPTARNSVSARRVYPSLKIYTWNMKNKKIDDELACSVLELWRTNKGVLCVLISVCGGCRVCYQL